MKKIYAIFSAVLLTVNLFAQSPQKMSYQAVIRNNSDQLVTNHAVGMQISILQASAIGTVVYTETQTPTTNANGLVSIEIGGGTVIYGDFTTIDWSTGTYYIKTETDPTGGTGYTITGTSQILSVPYALYANSVGNEKQNLSDVLSNGNDAENKAMVNVSQLGIGTATPEFNLTLAGDGGILATGTFFTGKSLLTSGEGTRMIWYPQKAAFRAGKVFDDEWDNENIGYNSVGIGVSSKASGGTSTAMGNYTTASGVVSTAMGNSTMASGFISTAIGNGTKASGSYSIAMGNGIEASGINSIAIALNDQTGTIVTQDNTMAIMGGNVGIGTISPAEPLTVNGVIAATEGNSTDWNAAFSWGDHASAGYLTSFTETDPTWTTASVNYYTKINMQTSGESQLHFNNLTNTPTTVAGFGITDAVTTIGNQTIAGNKTFSGTTTVITPVNANDAVNKAYVDNMLSIIQTIQTGARDMDGNTYKVILIGNQLWMAENLKTTKYNDGTAIPNITDNTAWAALTTGAYSDYNNTPSNSTTYGRLYNWYAVDNNAATKVASNGGKNVCPTGWHIPTDAEWTTLTDYLTNNGYGYEGSGTDIAKSMASTSGWTTYGTLGTVGNDQASNNSSGFTALPSGYRGTGGAYDYVGDLGNWWSSTETSATNAYCRYMLYDYSIVARYYYNKHYGFSVRCLRD